MKHNAKKYRYKSKKKRIVRNWEYAASDDYKKGAFFGLNSKVVEFIIYRGTIDPAKQNKLLPHLNACNGT